MTDRIAALLNVLDYSPENAPIRLLLAEELHRHGRSLEALEHYSQLLKAGQLAGLACLEAGNVALEVGQLELAGQLLEAARHAGVIEGVLDLEQGLASKRPERSTLRLLRTVPEAGSSPPLERAQSTVTFSEVGGLEAVKKVIHRMIILPFQRPELYERYGRKGGGGAMLYGPPGCGKTLMAKATAGECRLPFFNLRIEDVLDPYLGVSERNLHEAFEAARASAPCVLFIDELDALAFARRKQHGSASRTLVDQLLQELDAIGSNNHDLLILGATNAPWDVDDALKRPGRFDRLIFVPPPDEVARAHILERQLEARPAATLDLTRLARATPLFSGADLRSLVDQAIDRLIDEALETGAEPPLTMKHLEAELAQMRPTTLDWLACARNYVEFANQGDRYREIAEFLKSKEARAWKG